MATERELIRKRVWLEIREQLLALGLKKRAGHIYTRIINDEVLGFFGWIHSTRVPAVALQISPVFGVRHQPLERFVAELKGAKFDSYHPSTFSTPIAGLLDEPNVGYYYWEFDEDTPIKETVTEVTEHIIEYGFPFMEHYSTLDRMIDVLREMRFGLRDMNRYRHPAALLLKGERKAAQVVLRKYLKELEGDKSGYTADYHAFAARLEKMLASKK